MTGWGHDEVSELLGAYALDAVDDREREAIEAHLAGCPRCRAEVDAHLDVAARLAVEAGPAPAGLWDRIADALEEAPPPLRLAPVPVAGPLPQREDLEPRRRRVPVRWVAVGAAAAVVLIALLGVQVRRQADRLDRFEATVPQDALARAASIALTEDDARTAELVGPSTPGSASAVLTEDGSGYLLAHHLPDLPAGRTYQLWGVRGDLVVSLGVLGPHPGDVVAFRAGADLDSLVLTDEVAGGVVSSRNEARFAGTLES